MSERDFYLGSVDAENGRIISRGENPIIPFCARFEIFDTDTICINSNSLWEWFCERFKKSLELFWFVRKEVFLEILSETVIDFGFVFFGHKNR